MTYYVIGGNMLGMNVKEITVSMMHQEEEKEIMVKYGNICYISMMPAKIKKGERMSGRLIFRELMGLDHYKERKIRP